MKNHSLLMLLCCLIPVGLILAIFVLNIPVGTVVSFGIFLLCPILHLLLMRKMGHHHSPGRDEDEECLESRTEEVLPAEEEAAEPLPFPLKIDEKATALTRARYQRFSYFYDFMEGLAERRFRKWRATLWQMVEGASILEAGVGTGKNMLYWPEGVKITGIDLTPGMLEIAQARAKTLGLATDLRLADVQALDFPDDSFDAAVATFVFCSVPNPTLGLCELRRVVKPGGQVILLDHVRSTNGFLGGIMDFMNPLFVWIMGANINRQTVENVKTSGLRIVHVENLTKSGIFKLIVARTPNFKENGKEGAKAENYLLPEILGKNLADD